MKALSKVIKPQYEVKGNKLYLRYSDAQINNFTNSSTTLPTFSPDLVTGEETNYSVNQVTVDVNASRDNMIASLINDKYSVDDQIAMLANKDDYDHVEDYNEFQTFRAFVKLLVDNYLSL